MLADERMTAGGAYAVEVDDIWHDLPLNNDRLSILKGISFRIAHALALALGSAALVAWRPARLRPLEVLRAD